MKTHVSVVRKGGCSPLSVGTRPKSANPQIAMLVSPPTGHFRSPSTAVEQKAAIRVTKTQLQPSGLAATDLE